jgi:hypothetical protein
MPIQVGRKPRRFGQRRSFVLHPHAPGLSHFFGVNLTLKMFEFRENPDWQWHAGFSSLHLLL